MAKKSAILRGAVRRRITATRAALPPSQQSRPITPLTTSQADDKTLGRNVPWKAVPRSSWIAALRFIPVARVGNSRYATGYVDMMVKKKPRTGSGRYRYGPGINQNSFNTWFIAASKGKYWWRYFTRRWSPAQKI